jgi:hypothetical protein
VVLSEAEREQLSFGQQLMAWARRPSALKRWQCGHAHPRGRESVQTQTEYDLDRSIGQ